MKKPPARPFRLVLSWLLPLLLCLHAVVIPRGERWYDSDGSVCLAAEIVRCIPPVSDATAPLPPGAFHESHTDFVRDEGCTDCRHVSFGAVREEDESLYQGVFAADTAVLTTIAPFRPTPEVARRGVCYTPPPLLRSRILRTTNSPRAPPVS